MYTHYEQRQERTSHDYDRVDDSYDSLSTTGTTYRSAMSPRVTNVSRSRASALGGGGGGSGVMTRVYQSIQSSGGGGAGGFGPGLASLANFPGVPIRGSVGSNTALVGFNANRQRDKRELEHLNDKFAQYVEKVRFLEAQNRKLVLELEALRSRSGQGSSRIKEMYDIEMAEANRLVDETKRDAAAANAKNQQAEQEVKKQKARYAEVSNYRETDRKEIDAIQKQIAENEAQINLFRRRIADLEDEGRRYKGEGQRLASEIGRLQNEIQNEKFLKSSCEVEKLALEDELASLKHIHEADLTELRSQSVSNDLDPSQFFRNELSQAIREIRNDYENATESQRNDMQARYQLLYNELVIRQQRPDANPVYNEQQRRQEERLRTENLQMQNQNGYFKARIQDAKNRIEELQRKLNELREEGSLSQARAAKDIDEARKRLEQANRDFTEVSNLKTSLEKEIGTYRDLLESQNGLRGYVDRIVQTAEQQALERSSNAGGGGGGGGGRAGGSTTITRTFVNRSGASYGGGFGGGFGSGGGGFGAGGGGGSGFGSSYGGGYGGGFSGSYGGGSSFSAGGGGGGSSFSAGGGGGGSSSYTTGGGGGGGSGGYTTGGSGGGGGGSGGYTTGGGGGGGSSGGISTLVSQTSRPGTTTSYSTVSSGLRNTVRDSTDSQVRQSGDF